MDGSSQKEGASADILCLEVQHRAHVKNIVDIHSDGSSHRQHRFGINAVAANGRFNSLFTAGRDSFIRQWDLGDLVRSRYHPSCTALTYLGCRTEVV